MIAADCLDGIPWKPCDHPTPVEMDVVVGQRIVDTVLVCEDCETQLLLDENGETL